MSNITNFLCIQLFSLFLSTALYSSTLHLFVAVDSNSNLSKGVIADKKNITTTFEAIAKLCEMQFKERSISAKDLSGAAVSRCLEKFDVKSNDVFCFYYSGHGFRSKIKKCPWPALHFSATNSLLELASVISKVKKMKPRFALILCDSCNDTPMYPRGSFLVGSAPANAVGARNSAKLKKLFLKTKGIIISTAAKSGSKAWSSPRGGIFTNAFLVSLLWECEKASPSWKSIFVESKQLCKILQRPEVFIDIH